LPTALDRKRKGLEMKKRFMMLSFIAVLSLASFAVADDIALTLIPLSGDISGPAGSTIGWGYTITNNTALWIQTEAVSSDPFLNGTPSVIFDFPAVAPGSFVTQDFSLVVTGLCSFPPCGLYSLTWDTTAPVGFVNSGTFIVSSDFYSCDPSDPTCFDLGPAPDASAAYSATVTGSTVPEPTSLLLILSGVGAVGRRSKRA